jgi:hypothetical protein
MAIPFLQQCFVNRYQAFTTGNLVVASLLQLFNRYFTRNWIDGKCGSTRFLRASCTNVWLKLTTRQKGNNQQTNPAKLTLTRG